MKRKMRVVAGVLASVLAMTVLVGCGQKEPVEMPTVEVDPSITVELNGETLALQELIEKAQAEGDVQSVGMPDDWADWKDSWNSIKEIYGLSHDDVDMTSAEELAQFAAEKDDPTKDVGDIGLSMTPEAIAQDVVGSYKSSTWDNFPDWAKDEQGRWIMTYTGSIAFIANTEAIGGPCPTSWAQVREGDYLVSVGNVLGGAASQVAVLSCAIANGGSVDNIQPGIDFFKELAAAGRLDTGDTTSTRLASGEMVLCVGNYDYSVLAWRDNILAENPAMELDITIPSDGSVTNGYCQIINKYALHPYAAALTIEYLTSDDAAIERAKGYARPTKQDVELPGDVADLLLDDALYENCVKITDVQALNDACLAIAQAWEREVLPLIK